MKRTNTVALKQLINEFIRENKIDDKLKETRIISAWPIVLGPLAKSTEELYIRNRVLFVKLSSSVVRNELQWRRTTLVKSLNEKVGENVIIDILFR